MSLSEQLKEFEDKAFGSMPQEIAQGLRNAVNEVKSSQLKQKALKVGDTISPFVLSNMYGEKIDIRVLFKHKYLLINFYRGGWCAFCNLELRAYESLKDEFEKNGIDIVAISPEVEKYALKTKEENSLSFEVLSDEHSKVMQEFGIVFKLNDEVQKIYAGFDIDLKKLNGDESFQVPVPATYLIDKDLKIVFSHLEEDYTKRFEPAKVLDIVKSL